MAHNDLLGLPEGKIGSNINCVVSASSGSFTTTSTSDVDVTNLSVKFNATGDYPVVIQLIADGTTGGSYLGPEAPGGLVLLSGNLKIKRDGTTIYNWVPQNDSRYFHFPVSAVYHMDFPSKGTYTYKISVSAQPNSDNFVVLRAKLVVYEDRSLRYK